MSKRETEPGKYVRFVAPTRSNKAATKVTILQPKKRPRSASLSEIRKAVREVHGATRK